MSSQSLTPLKELRLVLEWEFDLTYLFDMQVLKTRGKAEQIVSPELLGTAKDVVAKADGLVIQPKENLDKSSEDVIKTE